MRNRGNGKGGGVAIGGLDASALGVDSTVLRNSYLLAVAYLEPEAAPAVEDEFIRPHFDIQGEAVFAELSDHRELGLEVRPSRVKRYFVRVKPGVLDAFCRKTMGRLPDDRLERERWEDEFLWQNSYRLNLKHYASLGKKAAFVLSHAKDLLILKLVGYAEDAILFWKLGAFGAKLWIGHQRYPTKGRIWHPGGAHPFIGMHEALVHNGDFANYSRVVKYLKQRHVSPLFLTDTEVSVQLFDLWTRAYGYPLEMAIEAMAPTTERDFERLSPARKEAYRAVQAASMKASPDGPWFFIVARSAPARHGLQLLGVTDTSMLRPQVFALQDHAWRVKGPQAEPPPAIGLIGSEKQAIDRVLEGLAAAGLPFSAPADKYWSARGGSYSDGGAFSFTLTSGGALSAADKFGNPVTARGPDPKFELARVKGAEAKALASAERTIGAAEASSLAKPASADGLLEIDATAFPVDGERSLGTFVAHASRLGWKRFRLLKTSGHRFLGCGLGKDAAPELDVYGSPGDYLGSGLCGGTIRVFNSAQDQVGQILNGGRLVVYGDVGQTFLYGAKGGECFVLGNAAGRPLINAVGKPRVVINGTCLDYLAESFMAGDPLHGGGFAIVNGVRFSGDGRFEELESPYPGGNLFSLASGGAIYFRDPARQVGPDQLNGGRLADLEPADWKLIEPYLLENERLFGLTVNALLGGLTPEQAYVKIVPTRLKALSVAHD
ncbi:MAG: glutamate synthase [Elusimicrobia bacterium]|nr:glutamate synthase [Elusimicrobiota bacterium]